MLKGEIIFFSKMTKKLEPTQANLLDLQHR